MLNHIRLTRALLRNPKAVGALVPSSRYLASQMVGLLPLETEVVVEFGAGTGPMTKALLDTGFSPDNLYVFELSEQLCRHLKNRFPAVHVINASATDIMDLDRKVCAIISSLPLKSIPDATVSEILAAAQKKLRPGGYFVQFTYDLIRYHEAFDVSFRHVSKHVVWANLPPARIDIFQKI